MKHPLSVLTLTIAGCIVGCQENAMDPFTESGSPAKAAPVPIVSPIVIPINAVLADPRPGFNNLVLLTGEVQSILTTVTGENGRLATYVVKVDQTVAIQLTSLWGSKDPEGKISSESSDNVTVSYGKAGLLQKAHEVSWSSDPGPAPQSLTLNMVFEVTSNAITVSKMWLSIPPDAGVDF